MGVITIFSTVQAHAASPKILLSYGDLNYFSFKNDPKSLSTACRKPSLVATYDYLSKSDNCALIWSSNTPLNGRIFLQVFENGTWIRISDSMKWSSGAFSDAERNGLALKKASNSQEIGSFQIKGLENPEYIQATKNQNSRFANGDLCWAQDAGPLRVRLLFNATSGISINSNEVRITYKNYEGIRYDGFQCVFSKDSPQSDPKTGNKSPGAKLPACTISQVIDLKNYIVKRSEAYEIQKSALRNIRIQQDAAARALSNQARENAYASIEKWTSLGQQAAGVVKQFELFFINIKTKCEANDVTMPSLGPIE